MLLFLLTLILVVVFLVYALIIFMRYLQLRRDYRSIPSLPISRIPFVGNLHQLDRRTDVFYQFLCKMAKECQEQDKGLFCLWYAHWPIVFLCKGQGLETFINSPKQLGKSFGYTFLQPWLKTALLISKDAKWRSRRRLITPSFHDTNLLHNFMTIFDNQSRILVQYYDECIRKAKGQPRDLYESISACTLDIITESAMGKNAGAQKSLALDINNDFVDATGRVTRIVHVRMRSPWLWPAFIFNRLPSGREHNQLLKILHGFSREIIQHRLTTFNAEQAKDNSEKKNRRPLVFLDNLISQMHAEQLSMDDIQEEVDGFILEGHDTTANAINYTCYLIGSYPDVQAKVHAEIDAIFADDFERACTMEDTYHMTYLESVIKESMRIFPPVPLIGREIQEDFVYRGQTIRKGTTVVVFLPGIHQDPSVFPDPEKFDPDRFSASAERSKDWSPYGFIPFSVGSRNCIGQRFAGFEEKVILSTLFRHFSFRSTQTIDELHLSADMILRPLVPIKMIIKRRHRH